MVDLDMSGQFLDLIDEGGVFTFQSLPEASDASGASRYPKVLHGTLGEHGRELEGLNNLGAGIFVMINEGDGVKHHGQRTCRTEANIVGIRANFVDLDGSPIGPVLTSACPPHWVVVTSPGRFHAYWKVIGCPREDFERVQVELAARFDGDAAVKDLPRIMRIPGFLHRKKTPYLSRLYLPKQFTELMEDSHE